MAVVGSLEKSDDAETLLAPIVAEGEVVPFCDPSAQSVFGWLPVGYRRQPLPLPAALYLAGSAHARFQIFAARAYFFPAGRPAADRRGISRILAVMHHARDNPENPLRSTVRSGDQGETHVTGSLMAEVNGCPTPDELRRFLLGQVNDAEASRFERHLSACQACLDSAANLQADDTLLAAMRAQTPPANPDAPIVEDLMGRLEALHGPRQELATNQSAHQTDQGASIESIRSSALDPDQTGPYERPSDELPANDQARQPLLNGRYVVGKELGHGGMGQVYLGQDSVLGRAVAIKMIRPRDPQLRDRSRYEASLRAAFVEEARIGANLTHPAIATVFDFGFQGPEPFIVFEYIGGETLRGLIERRAPLPLPLEDVRLILGPLAQALDFAHSQHVVHRDLKPDNIRATTEGIFKILDLGLAKEFRHHVDWRFAGTPAYASPEQAAGLPCDGRTDQYALGLITHEMLTGHRVFENADRAELLRLHREQEPPSPQSFVPDLPESVCSAVLRALQKAPNRRFTSCAEFALACGCQLLNAPVPLPEVLALTEVQRMWGVWTSPRFRIPGAQTPIYLALSRDRLWVVYRGEMRYWPLDAIRQVRRNLWGNELHLSFHQAHDGARQSFSFAYRLSFRWVFLIVFVAGAGIWTAAVLFGGGSRIPITSSVVIGCAVSTVMAALFSGIVWLVSKLIGRPDGFKECRQWQESLQSLQGRSRIAAAAHTQGQQVQQVVLMRRPPAMRYQALGPAEFQDEQARRAEVGLQVRAAMMGADAVVDLERERLPHLGRTIHRRSGMAVKAVDADGRRELRSRWLATHVLRLSGWMLALIGISFFGTLLGGGLVSIAKGEIGKNLSANINPFQLFGNWIDRMRFEDSFQLPDEEVLRTLATLVVFIVLIHSWPFAIALLTRLLLWPQLLRPAALAIFALGAKPLAALAAWLVAAALHGRWGSGILLLSLLDPTNLAILLFACFLSRKAWRAYGEYRNLAPDSEPKIPASRRAAGRAVMATSVLYLLLLGGFVAWSQYSLVTTFSGAEYWRVAQAEKHFAEGQAKMAHDPVAAESALQRSISLWQELIHAPGARPEHRHNLAAAYQNLGLLLLARPDKVKEGENFLKKALTEYEQLEAVFSTYQKHKKNREALQQLLAQLSPSEHLIVDAGEAMEGLKLQSAGQHQAAHKVLREALERHEQKRREFSDQAEYLRLLASKQNRLAWFLAICTEVVLRDPKQAVELAAKAVENLPQEGMFWNTLGAAHYRAGNWNECLTALETSMELRPATGVFDWVFLAMAHHQLGNTEEANKWLDKSLDWISQMEQGKYASPLVQIQWQSHRGEAQSLRQEAEALIRPE